MPATVATPARRVLTCLGVAVLSVLMATPVGTRAHSSSRGLLFGAFVASGPSPTAAAAADSQSALERFEERIGRKLDLHRLFLRWDDPLTSAAADVERRRTPVLSIQPTRRNGTRLTWASVASGRHDDDIAGQARAIAALGTRVLLTFNHEPDFSPGFGTPGQYVAAWRHYVGVFRDEGVHNVTWTWTMAPSSFRHLPVGAGADAYYPGDDVVDWIALDAYNWFGCQHGKPKAWRSLAEIAGPFRAWALPHGKPLMLAESGSSEDRANPWRKARWLRESMRTLAGWPEFRAVLYLPGSRQLFLVGRLEPGLAAGVHRHRGGCARPRTAERVAVRRHRARPRAAPRHLRRLDERGRGRAVRARHRVLAARLLRRVSARVRRWETPAPPPAHLPRGHLHDAVDRAGSRGRCGHGFPDDQCGRPALRGGGRGARDPDLRGRARLGQAARAACHGARRVGHREPLAQPPACRACAGLGEARAAAADRVGAR
ncbi:MAG TPA: hypothetical protein VKP64_00725 [Mycobacteriales bacterium]|nr:hypothetical protein [Mycobacteriales bacterium]